VAPAVPELDDGADDEPNEPEPDDDDEPEFDDELEPDELEPVDAEPEPADFPLLAWDDDPVLMLCAAAGSSTITTPATVTPTIPAPMVALRSLRPARSRAKMADTVRSSLFILGLLYRGQYPISVGGADLTVLGSSSGVALSSRGFRPGRRRRTALPARPSRPHSGKGGRRRHA
jgi:hypothetical protein